MRYWHKPLSQSLSWVLVGGAHGLRPKIKLRDIEGSQFDVLLVRWPGSRTELWPRVPVTTDDYQEARKLARELMDSFGITLSENDFEERPRVKPRLVETIQHAGGVISCVILLDAEGLYEVRYFARELMGEWPPDKDGVVKQEWDSVRTRWNSGTYADTLECARSIAAQEMDELDSEREAASEAGSRQPVSLLAGIFAADARLTRQ